MTVLVTGATGFVGRNLWPVLSAKGHTLRLLVRSPEGLAAPSPGAPLPELAVGDLTRPSTLRDAVRGVDAVIHCAALMSDRESAPWPEFKAHNVEGTRALLDACGKEGVPWFLHISTTLVTGPSGREAGTEDAELNPGPSRYVRSKALAEEAVRSVRDVPWTILRLPPLYGPGMRYGWPDAMRLMRRRRFHLIGGGKARMHLTHIDDVVAGIALALRRGPQLRGRIYNLAGPEPTTLGEAFSLLASELGAAPPRNIPYPVAWIAAAALTLVPDSLKPGPLKLLLPYRLRYFVEDHVYDTARARRDFGFEPKIRPAEGLRRMAAEFLGQKNNGQ